MEPVREINDRTIAHSAVEVVSLFGQSVQDVTHLEAPRPARRKRALLCMGGGAALVLLAAIVFAAGVDLAGTNEAALASHLESGKAAHEFRPERMSRAADALALMGSIGGILLIGFGLARLRAAQRPSRVRAGQGRDCQFAIALAVPDFDAVAVDEKGRGRVRVPLATSASDLRGCLELRMHRGGDSLGAEAMVAQGLARFEDGDLVADVPENGSLSLGRGEARLMVARKPAPARHGAVAGRFDRRVGLFLAGSAAVHLLFLALLKTVPVSGGVLGDLEDDQMGRLVSLRADATEPELLDEPEAVEDTPSARGEDGEEVSTGTRSTMGSESSRSTERAAAIANRGEPPTLARAEAARRAREAGILGVMSARPELFANLNAASDFSSGIDSADYAGGEFGDLGDAQGEWTGAWGSRYHFVGSPYYREGTVKVGRLPTGARAGYDMNAPGGFGKGLRKRSAGVPVARDPFLGPATTSGALDKTIIRRHIRRKLAQIRHCYERRLMVAPDLAGTVVSSFTISPMGKVQGASARGANDRPLEECVASVLATIEFPRTDDGGAVAVTYPFTFQSVGT